MRSKIDEVLATEPFASSKARFNVWQVNVVSAESGVDNDPQQGVAGDTALDMGLWCGDIERLLCVNTTKARQYAAEAPGTPQRGSPPSRAGRHPRVDQMVQQRTKWHAYLGKATPDGGVIGAFQGGMYCQNVYRRARTRSCGRSGSRTTWSAST